MLKIKNIKWDTDGDKEVFASLPQEIDFDENKLHLECKPSDECYEDELLDAVADWLSDEYGFCHGGFSIEDEIVENDTKRLRDIVEWAVAKEGYKVLEVKNNAIIIRNALLDQDFEIAINSIAG